MKWNIADEIQYMNKLGKNFTFGYQTALRIGWLHKVLDNIDWISCHRNGLQVLVVQWNTGVCSSTIGILYICKKICQKEFVVIIHKGLFI